MNEIRVSIGDIVLFNQFDGVQVPGIICALLDQDNAVVTLFSGGGVAVSSFPIPRGTSEGHWQPREK